MLASRTDTLRFLAPHSCDILAMLTFWELTARFNWAKSDEGSTVPRNIDLYWFIPALANSKVGSECGTTEEEGTAHVISIIGTYERSETSATEFMSILLEELYECVTHFHCGPLLF